LVLGLAGALLGVAPAAGQSLEESLATAYTTNPSLLAARARLKAVNEGVPQELSNWRPRVTVNASAGKQRTESDGPLNVTTQKTTPLTAELGVEQSLYRGGRTVAGTRRAEASVLAERQVLTSVEQDVLLSAATSYMDVWRDQSVLQLNVSNERVLQRQLEASRDRFEVGEITRTDVAQSESRLARATADRIAAEGDLTASRAVFQEVVGIYPMLLEEPPALEGLPASQDEVIAAAAAAQPDLVSAKFTEEASRHQVRVSLGELFPEVSLNGEIGYEDETSIEDSDAEFYRILAQVTVPLYQQGLVSSRVREDKQIANQRRIEIDQAGRAAEQNAISAWEDLQTGRAQIVSFQSEVDSSRIALEGVRQENAVGARTILDILDAEQEFLDAQVSLVRARRDESVAGYAVLAAMGRLTAGNLGLPVAVYDPIKDYDAVRDKWFGLSIPEE
jgi:TolC family type I secretion outer membrane protein